MGEVLFLLALGAIALAAAWTVEGRGGRVAFTAAMAFAAVLMAVLLTVVDDRLPFTAGGDDYGYFDVSRRELKGWADWLGFRAIRGYEQGGYPLLLLWVHQVVGDSLYARKALNLFFFLVLASVWYAIGRILGGRRFAFACGVGVLLATPLWYYWAFLLKDMTVVLLQSLFLLGMARVATRRSTGGTWILLLVTTFLLIPLRIYMVLVNVAVLAATALLMGRQSRGRKVAITVASVGVVALFAGIGTSERALRALGVRDNRLLEYSAVMEVSSGYMSRRERYSTPTGTAVFPALFVVGETTGLRMGSLPPGTGEIEGAGLRLRGAAALPWLFFGAPLSVLGLLLLLRPRAGGIPDPPGAARGVLVGAGAAPPPVPPQPEPLQPVPAGPEDAASRPGVERGGWLPLLLFLGFFVVIAWIVEDTVRWRLPAVPVLVGLAAHAWLHLTGAGRLVLLLGWSTAVVGAATLFHAFLR
jgi:hypothetical protein